MFPENLKLFFYLYFRPLAAMSDLIDKGNWFFGAAAVTLVAILLTFAVTSRIYRDYEFVPVPREKRVAPDPPPEIRGNPEAEEAYRESMAEIEEEEQVRRLPLPLIGNKGWWLVSFNPTSMFAIALSLAALYVPATILIWVLLIRTSSFDVAFRRDYGSLLICTLMAWAAAHLPFALAGWALKPVGNTALLLWLGGNLLFGGLMIGALRTVLGAGLNHAVIIVGLAWIVLRADSWLFSIATFSPFLTIIWGLPLILGVVYGVRASHLQRQSFRRYLESATINPRDAEAHYQLGLIYQQRRRYAEAINRFRRAVEIDPKEPDANYQLGQVARQEGRLQDAINHFSIVVAQDDKFRQSEIWREIGATYLAAGMYSEARSVLEKYLGRRPFDPEGHYHLGETLRNLGQIPEASNHYKQCIEAVRTMPYYRRHELRKWSKLAEARL